MRGPHQFKHASPKQSPVPARILVCMLFHIVVARSVALATPGHEKLKLSCFVRLTALRHGVMFIGCREQLPGGNEMASIDAAARALRVLVVHPAADLYGSDRVLLESVQALLDRGDQVAVALPGPGPLVDQLRGRGALVEFCPTPVLRKSLLSPAGLLGLAGETARGLYRGVALLRRYRPDALYVSTVTIPLWPLLGRLAGVPTVTHVHEAERHAALPLRVAWRCPCSCAPARGQQPIQRGHLGGITARAARPRPSDLQRSARAADAGAGPRLARRRPTGGLRGPALHRKGVDVAVEAVAELRRRGVNATLDLVGAVFPGYEDFERALRDRAGELGLGEAVAFHGFQPRTWDFFAAADAVVVPSRLDEPFGNTAVEAVLAARPVVVSDTSGLREAAAGYSSAQFTAPGDPGVLADALARIAADWEAFRTAAAADAAVAGERHAPEQRDHRGTDHCAGPRRTRRQGPRSFSTGTAGSRRTGHARMSAPVFAGRTATRGIRWSLGAVVAKQGFQCCAPWSWPGSWDRPATG